MKLDPMAIKVALEEMVKEYNFDPKQTMDIIKAWIKTAFRKDYLKDKKYNIEVNFDKVWAIKIFRKLDVVEEVEDEFTQVTEAQAKEMWSETKVGESFLIDITPESIEFSRIWTQSAAQTIKQAIRQIEKERFYDKFADKEWELLRWKVVRVYSDNAIVDIEWTMVILGPESQIPNKVYSVWEDVWVLLRQISKGTGWIMLDITQSWTDFIDSLLRKNIPEVEDWRVEIIKIARISGKRTKVLVSSSDEKIDPVGVFVGQYGQRIENLLNALGGEKIDIIENTDDPAELVKRSLKPAKINRVNLSGSRATAVCDESQKAVAIWKWATNLKLASQLSWYIIDIN